MKQKGFTPLEISPTQMSKTKFPTQMSKAKFITGFTFIELLVAISIFSVVAVAIYSAFSTGVLAWRKGEAGSRIYQDARSALELMASELKNCIYHSQLKFSGGANEISFSLVSDPIGDYPKTISAGSAKEIEPSNKIQPPIFMVTYYIEQMKAKGSDERETEGVASGALMRKQEEFLEALARISAQEPTEASGEEEVVIPEEKEEGITIPPEGLAERETESAARIEEILPEVQSLEFQYCYINPEEEGEFEWRDTWDIEEVIPQGVKITLSLPSEGAVEGEATETLLNFTKFVFIPSGSLGEEEEEEKKLSEMKELLENRQMSR